MRVLVTGGGGFVGRQALPLLAERGHEVHALTSRGRDDADGVRWHRADLLAPGGAA
ncbi:NAD-dependent epimerase/dehydratase family protein, partial [Longimicrobium sp.]|uniref:NAD-dependent epimerase/dehydratase family protein n=1 Tax=Longimicrobium sp. TaxID=2029185 RepID=UPI0032C21355